MKNHLMLAFLLGFILALPAQAEDTLDESPKAEQGDKKTKIIYRKRTAVSFDDAVVEGTTTNPEGVYVVSPPEKQFGSLLKLRPNFHRELMRDALLLR